MLTQRMIKYTIILVAIFIASSQIIFAQDVKADKQLNELVSTLTQKVLLNSDQETKVLGILNELKSNISAKPDNKDLLVKDAQSKVESLLDKKQKMKYDILKNDFWKKVVD